MKASFHLNKKMLFLCFTIIFILVVFLAPIYRGVNLLSIVSQKRDYYALSEGRQELFDTMKIEYVNIKNRVTGTAPFNEGTSSNADGIDVTDNDDYVRTLDVMKYTVELGISPNTDHPGVTSSSVYEGGVIKVRAKLPNQGTPTLMRWEQDAWMQNVKYSNDKTEIYAEYHVPNGVSVTNANQNLTFTVKVDGYKKEVTSEMAPEFEVWMEGNKPDDSTSDANAVVQKDSRNTIISAKPSIDAGIYSNTWMNIKATREIDGEEVVGQYLGWGFGTALYQPDKKIEDMRGIEYPVGPVQIKYKLKYYFKEDSPDSSWSLIDENTSDAKDLVNGTIVVAAGLNQEPVSTYYPKPVGSYVIGNCSVPRGSLSYGASYRSVQDSGTFTYNYNNSVLETSYEDYVLNGIFPERTSCYSMNNVQTFAKQRGYFTAGNMQLFVPHYDAGNHDYQYQIDIDIDEIRYGTLSNPNIVITRDSSGLPDGLSSNNTANMQLQSRLNGNITQRFYNYNSKGKVLSNPDYVGNDALIVGDTFTSAAYLRGNTGPYEGGSDSLIIWNSYLAKMIPYDDGTLLKFSSSCVNGMTPSSTENIKEQFGILKNSSEPLSELSIVNRSTYEDFDWYDDYEDANAHGIISAIFIEDPDNIGNTCDRYYKPRFKITDDLDAINKQIFFRFKSRYYGDKEKTQVFYYNRSGYTSENSYTPTIYRDDGTIEKYHVSYENGGNILILGVKSSVVTTVTDVDSSNIKKRSYDIKDGEVHIKISPSISDDSSTGSQTNKVIDEAYVYALLPSGLSYKNGSANKTPESVTINLDGSTKIVWKYDNWEVNQSAPEYPEITYTAELSASLDNNSSIDIKAVIFTDADKRDEKQYRTSEYGIVISNLAGSTASKGIDKPVIEKNESFLVTSTLGNNSEEALRNVKTIEILPTNNDANGSKFSGNYTSKIISKINTQKIFYTTNEISSIGLTEDRYGKLTIKDVDLENDSRWIEVQVGEEIPSNATAIASVIPSLQAKSEEEFVIEFSPVNNMEEDMYAFNLNMTSDNLQAAIKTNTVITKVVSRKISGKAFIDENRDGIYDSNDTLLKRNVIRLLDGNDNVVATTQTDENGKYIFEDIAKGNYYVEFSIPDNYETITKGQVSKVNSNGKTDLIETLNVVPTEVLIEVKDVDMGIQKISAKIFVRYEEYGNPQNLFDSKDFDKYYGDTYNLDDDYTPTIPDNYEFKEKSSNYAGTVNKKETYITYYYQKKDSKLTSSIAKSGTDKITNKTDFVSYKITYKTKIEDYLGQATIKIVDTLPYEIDENHSNIAGGVYDSSTKTITWTINKNIASINEPEIVIEKDLKLKYLNINSRSREMVNIVDGVVTLDSKERSVENQFLTKVEIPGKITVKYIEVDKNNEEIKKLVDPIETTNLIGERYTSEEKSFEGYVLVEKPNTEEYFYEEEEQEVVYKYEKIQVKVETKVHGIGGKIVGDEVVYYGENSTKDKIVIEAEEGYQIERIVINGEEMKIKGIQTKMILDNFKEMKEDKLVEVSFKKIEKIKNPTTGRSNFIIIILIIGIMLYTIKRYKIKVKNNI